jgi:cytochrome P450
MDNLNSFTLATAGLAFLFVTLNHLLSPEHDPREPPMVPPSIPIFGHMFGFMRHSFAYYGKLRDRSQLPIFTVCMPGRKIYIVTKPDLISKVDKKNKSISFAPIISEFSSVTCGTSKEANEILEHNLFGEHGAQSLVEDMVVGMRETLKPSKMLDDMNQTMAREVSDLMDAIKPEPGQRCRKIQLGGFVEHVVTMATTNSVYGPHNPYKNKEVKEAFFAFEKGIMKMLVAPFPTYTARKYIAEREKVAKALGTYFAEGHHEEGSGLAKARWDYSVKNRVPIPDIGRFEIGGTIAILLNTLPSVYWMLLIVHVVPGLLADLRREIHAALTLDSERKKATIDVTVVKNECPLLMSTLKESLRIRGMGTAVRMVLEDTELSGYLLKKGTMLQIPIGVAHSDRDHWGADTDLFDPRRFLKDPASGKKVPDDSGYRAFGGGKHLCPGRWFAVSKLSTGADSVSNIC